MSSQVYAVDRFRLHGLLRELPAGPEKVAVTAATYWESFPGSYSPELVAAARALHVAGRAGFDSQEWADALGFVLSCTGGALRV